METMHKIQTLEKLINLGIEDGLIDKTLSKLIQYKTNKMERELQELEDSMKKFESEYNMDTETFYKKFEEGELGDERSWDEIHVHLCLRQCGTTSPITSRYPTLRMLCPTSFNRVSVSFRDSSLFLSGAPNRHFTIELTVSEIERI